MKGSNRVTSLPSELLPCIGFSGVVIVAAERVSVKCAALSCDHGKSKESAWFHRIKNAVVVDKDSRALSTPIILNNQHGDIVGLGFIL